MFIYQQGVRIGFLIVNLEFFIELTIPDQILKTIREY